MYRLNEKAERLMNIICGSPYLGVKPNIPFIRTIYRSETNYIITVYIPNGDGFKQYIEDDKEGWANKASVNVVTYPTWDKALHSAMDFLVLHKAGLF